MDSATVMVLFIAFLTIAITLISIYTAFGPNSKDLEDPMMNHTHGSGSHSHSHGLFSHSHSHGLVKHSHAHDHSPENNQNASSLISQKSREGI